MMSSRAQPERSPGNHPRVLIDPTAAKSPHPTGPRPERSGRRVSRRDGAGGHDGCVTRFDADLVERWFDLLLAEGGSLRPLWGIELTEHERAAVEDGAGYLLAAVRGDDGGDEGSDAPPPCPEATGPGDATEVPARMLRRYLRAFASGVAGAQARLDPDEWIEGEPAAASMSVAAGLNAGAAALQGEFVGSASTRPSVVQVHEPTAAQAAWLAGIGAAEEAVNGARVAVVTRVAFSAAAGGWRIGMPADPHERIEYRARGLLCLALLALREVCAEPAGPVEPASCGAMPGENLGRPFAAEVTFQVGTGDEDFADLVAAIRALSTDVTTWQREGLLWCHVHTERPGEVIEQAHASGAVFDLRIGLLDISG